MPVLRRQDARRPFQLHIDWSTLGIRTVLTEKNDDDKDYVITYASRSNNGWMERPSIRLVRVN